MTYYEKKIIELSKKYQDKIAEHKKHMRKAEVGQVVHYRNYINLFQSIVNDLENIINEK